ncbi:LLM class flavin-dependent oxidoreductase [Mariniluteicoccus endophyticus]
MSIPLSVLDLAMVNEGESSGDALARTLRLASHAESEGYARFWVAEHHNMPAIASTAPAVLIAAIAARTERIRVGSGGVMLPNHAPYVVAEQFALLEALHPNRIDLGIGRAPGTDQRTAMALRRDAGQLGVEEFPQHILDVLAWLGDDRLEESLALTLSATPAATSHPEVWLLGSSGYAAQLAGMLGLRYCYAHHFGQMDPMAVMDAYRSRFQPSPALSEPYAMVCTSALTAPTAEEADHLAGPARVAAMNLRTNQRAPIVSPEVAAQREWSSLDLAMLDQLPAIKFVGEADDVAGRLKQFTERLGVQELMLTGTAYAAETKERTLSDIASRW